MRPKEVWEKTHSQRGPHEKRKRAPRGRKPDSETANSHAGSDASQGTLNSDASSPPNEANPEEGVVETTELPPAKRQRAMSVQMAPVKTKGNSTSDATAAVALKRAIQSSPARIMGTQKIPIEVEDLTPKPTRRMLFPSPTQSEEGRALRGARTNSEKKIQHNPQPSTKDLSPDHDQDDKENCPPVDEGSIDHLFERNDDQPISRPITPTPSSNVRTPSFKTPQRSNSPRRTPKTSDFFSSAARALLRPITTPQRTPTRSMAQPLGEITPFTAHLNSLLSEAHTESPSNHNFDFPSLPSLNSSPTQVRNDFDFSHFDAQDFLSTDAPMPSSPPAWFGVYVDPVEQGNGLWSDYQLPVPSPLTDEAGVVKTPKTPGLTVDENGRATIDFPVG